MLNVCCGADEPSLSRIGDVYTMLGIELALPYRARIALESVSSERKDGPPMEAHTSQQDFYPCLSSCKEPLSLWDYELINTNSKRVSDVCASLRLRLRKTMQV